MRLKVRTISVETDASGDFSSGPDLQDGVLMRVTYVPHASTPLDTGADLTITESETGQAIYTQANIGTSAFIKLPRLPIASAVDGVDSLTIYDYIPVNDKITLTIANGGDTKSGTFHLLFGEHS